MEFHRSESDGVVTLVADDGDKNVLDTEGFRRLDAELDACADADAVVWAGRPGVFSAGLDLAALRGLDREGLHELLTTFGRTLMRVWLEPRPVVCAATGHAIAAGTMFAMACDHTVAAAGDYYWGLTETQIDIELPHFAIAVARANVRTDRFEDLLLPGARVDAETAVECGFADRTAPPEQVVARAQERAAELAALSRGAYAGTKLRLRGEAAERVRAGLEDDIAALLARTHG